MVGGRIYNRIIKTRNKRQVIRLLTASLLLFFSIQFMLPVLLSLSIFVVREQQQSYIASSCDGFRQIRLTEQELNSVAVDNEIEHDGMRFDIKSVTNENGVCIVTALPDSKETNLRKLQSSTTGKEKPESVTSSQPFSFLYYEEPLQWHIPVLAKSEQQFHYQDILRTSISLVVTPPPQLFC